MSTNITSDNGVELSVGLLALEVTDPVSAIGVYARLSDAQRVELAAALDPGRRGLHVRLDNQAATLATYRRERDEALRKKGEMVDRAVRAERERDVAVARAEAAESAEAALRADQWPRDDIKPGDDVIYLGNWYGSSPCPRGAVFTVRAVHEDSGRVSFEWPGVDGACVDLSRVRKVEIAAPVPAPAVARADIEKALDTGIRGATDGGLIDQDTSIPSGECVRLAVDAVCDLFGVEAEQTVDPVEAKVTTRHPENYRLVNEADGSEWRMTRDGSWVAADSVGQEADQ